MRERLLSGNKPAACVELLALTFTVQSWHNRVFFEAVTHQDALERHPVMPKPNHRAVTLRRRSSCTSLPQRRGVGENVNNMPEISRERETEAGTKAGQRREQGNQSSRNIVSVASQFADDHLTLLRNISVGLAIAGVVVTARSIKLITKFQAASEIPLRFIERNVSLRGKVCSITEGRLTVEHVPIYLPFLSPLLSKHRGLSSSPLLVHLAGVELTQEGRVWLQKNLAPAQTVWLKLISREDDTLHCLVSQSRRWMWSYCVNEELLRLGLARTAPLSGVLPGSRLYWRLHKQLHRAEVRAERKGRGLWKEDSLWERAAKAFRDNVLVRLMRRIFKRT